MPLSAEQRLRIATGREHLRQRLHAHPNPEALVLQVADAGVLGKKGGLRFVVISDVNGRRFDIVPARGDDRSARLARKARERVIQVEALGQGWQLILGAVLAVDGTGQFNDPYVLGSYREAQFFAVDLADAGGMSEYNVQLAVSLGLMEGGDHVSSTSASGADSLIARGGELGLAVHQTRYPSAR